jgi:hypothetical protein
VYFLIPFNSGKVEYNLLQVVLYQNAKICVTRFKTKLSAPPWTQHVW